MRLENVTLKGALAFFLVVVSAGMVFLWMTVPPKGDGNAIALLAGFVTLFIKMAADAIGYQFQSSDGSEKLANKVVPAAASPPAQSWWSKLTEAEKNTITAAGPGDPRVAAFVSAATSGTATTEDLAYLVTKGLLPAERAAAIQNGAPTNPPRA